jgi:hypothetical protein|tara:strand:+ start:345 stop:482 length:138 start_codon:yes stop_codon:yes gene_type:complete
MDNFWSFRLEICFLKDSKKYYKLLNFRSNVKEPGSRLGAVKSIAS